MPAWLAAPGIPLIGGIAVAAIAIVVALLTRPPAATIEVRPRERTPTPTTMIYVQVAGAVNAPGVFHLPGGSRVFEAIDAAGGKTEDADDSELNLVAPMVDGQKLVVPQRIPPTAMPEPVAVAAASVAQDEAVAPPPTPRPTARPAPQTAASAGARINLNTATLRMLDSLPGIGPVTAQRIIDFRQANGRIESVEQLRDARVINNSVYERIKDLVTAP